MVCAEFLGVILMEHVLQNPCPIHLLDSCVDNARFLELYMGEMDILILRHMRHIIRIHIRIERSWKNRALSTWLHISPLKR